MAGERMTAFHATEAGRLAVSNARNGGRPCEKTISDNH
jgi:hypothetical protein